MWSEKSVVWMMPEKHSSQIRHNLIGQGYEFKFYSKRNRILIREMTYDLCYFFLNHSGWNLENGQKRAMVDPRTPVKRQL